MCPGQVLPVVAEVCSANASMGGRPIVILAHKSKEAMEEELHKHLKQLQGSHIICRCPPGCAAACCSTCSAAGG